MRAMVLMGTAPVDTAPLRLIEMPDPEPGPGEVRLRVRVCGICRTDLHVIEGELPPVRLPLVPGHQIVGVVDRCGPGTGRFRPGDRVGVAWLRRTCGACPDCRRGDENLCAQSSYTGYHEHGGYAELAVVPEAFAYPIPDVFSDEEAAPLLCAGIIGYRALRRSEVRPGERLGLFGFGSSAHITLQVALHRGCQVYVSTRGEAHRALARQLGAIWVGGADEPPPVPLDGAILFAPAGELVPPALRALRPGGTLVVAGIYLSPVPAMTYKEHLFHEKRLTSVEANTRRDGEDLLREAAAIPLRPRVQVFTLPQANHALQALKHDGIDGTGLLRVATA
ncbi:MAG: zinc-dependent alcohol dehydrogenase family protein [Myxococcales bacterium]|nr:zinc-dependent alcohol dehydrogenase family protein [Myxococcota bacterium]MDW8281793.1 zinc-dependent alcohol dehydrogenase family protein [Myxococcales bacterium]